MSSFSFLCQCLSGSFEINDVYGCTGRLIVISRMANKWLRNEGKPLARNRYKYCFVYLSMLYLYKQYTN